MTYTRTIILKCQCTKSYIYLFFHTSNNTPATHPQPPKHIHTFTHTPPPIPHHLMYIIYIEKKRKKKRSFHTFDRWTNRIKIRCVRAFFFFFLPFPLLSVSLPRYLSLSVPALLLILTPTLCVLALFLFMYEFFTNSFMFHICIIMSDTF